MTSLVNGSPTQAEARHNPAEDPSPKHRGVFPQLRCDLLLESSQNISPHELTRDSETVSEGVKEEWGVSC